MTVQRRPLSGMVNSTTGVAAPLTISNVAPTTIHTMDTTADSQGGPFVDQVTVLVQNPTAGNLDVTITIAGGTPIVQTIVAKATAAVVLDNVPFFGNGTSSLITGQGSNTGLLFFGWFARPL